MDVLLVMAASASADAFRYPMLQLTKYLACAILCGNSSMIVHAQDRYFTATGQENGKPLIFRGLSEVPVGVQEADLASRVAILWRYRSPANGMPDAETNNAQITFEDALEPLDVNDTGRLMLVVTGNERKEWHWYVKDFDGWMAQLNQRLARHPAYPIEITHNYEPDWTLYKDFMATLSGSEATK